MDIFFRPLTLLLAAGVAFQAAPAQSGAPAAASGTTTFHSDALQLDYTYPKAFVTTASVADQAVQSERDKTTGVANAAANCLSFPLAAIDSDGFRIIGIMRMDGGCLGMSMAASSLDGAATSALTQSLQRFGAPSINSAADYQLGGHDASAITGTVTSEKDHLTFYAASSCLVQGKDLVCFELLASDCAQLRRMMRFPVRLDGKAAEALIPAKFALRCAP